MGWVWLVVTIAFEVTGATLMKLANGFTVLAPSIGVFVCYGLSLAGLTLVLKTIELSVAYAIWSGVGTAATALIGIWVFGETGGLLKIASIGLIVAGVVGLHIAHSNAA